MKIKNPNAKSENIIVVITSVVLAVVLLLSVGQSGIEDFFSNPIVWKESDFIKIEALNFEPSGYDENYGKLNFIITNESEKEISSYEFIADVFGKEIKIYSTLNLEPYSAVAVYSDVGSNEAIHHVSDDNKFDSKTFEKVKNISAEKLNFKTKHIYDTSGNVIINNNGKQRIIAVFVPSFIFGLIGFLEIIKTKWLRMVFKFCGMPVVAVFAIFMLCGYLANSGLAPKTTSNTNANVAKQKYREAANRKRGAVARGDKNAEALAQREMDKAMADVMRENGKVSAASAQKFKNAASNYAGARMSGTKDALASATHNRETAFADMISPNTDANRKFKEASNAKRGAQTIGNKDLEAAAQKRMDDALADMLSSKN